MAASYVTTGSSTKCPVDRMSSLFDRVTTVVRHTLCGLHGHLYVLNSAPGHLSLRCFACGAQTSGWAIDVRPAFRGVGPTRARVATTPQRVVRGTLDGAPRPLRRAAQERQRTAVMVFITTTASDIVDVLYKSRDAGAAAIRNSGYSTTKGQHFQPALPPSHIRDERTRCTHEEERQ